MSEFKVEEIVSAKFKFADGTESDVTHWFRPAECDEKIIDALNSIPENSFPITNYVTDDII